MSISTVAPAHRSRTDPDDTNRSAPYQTRLLLSAVAVGIGFDLAIHRPLASVAHATLIAVSTVALVASGGVRSKPAAVLAACALVLGSFVAFRASTTVVILDAALAWALLWVAASLSTTDRLLDLPARRLPSLVVDGTVEGFRMPARIEATIGARMPDHRRGSAGRIAGGAALATPIVAVLWALLASADVAFGAITAYIWSPGSQAHALIALIGVFGALLLLGYGESEPSSDPDQARPLGATQAIVILGAIVAVFAVYLTTVAVTAVVGVDEIVDDPAETAQWARSGFFQLLFAAGVTLATQVLVERLVAREASGAGSFLGWLSVAASSLVLAVVGLSIFRLVAYTRSYGLTMLRLSTVAFAAWLGIVFLSRGLRAAGLGARRAWTTPVIGASALAIAVALSIANPEAIIARYNLENADSVEQFDVYYLAERLGTDAVPTLVAHLDQLEPREAAFLIGRMCERFNDPAPDGLSWNRSRTEAHDAVAPLC